MKTPLRDQLEKAEAEAKRLRRWETRAANLRREIRKQEREEQQAREAQEAESIKTALAGEYAVPRDAAFEEAWRIANETGHSYGFGEVRSYFGKLIGLVKLARNP